MTLLSGLFSVAGGLALFLFGVESCQRSFQQVGGHLKSVLFYLARGRFKPFFFGTFLTLLSQNSTVATSLAIAFVDVGAMSLTEAIKAMSGASFGGGLVVLFISLKVTEIAPLLLFISLLLIRMSQKNEIKNYGRVLQGISMIFLGMMMLQTGVTPIVQDPKVKELILWGSQNFLLIGLIAFLLTSLIQNNTAVVAIAISIASTGLISDIAAMAIVLGAHIGSTTIILISGLSGRLNSKRLGLATVLYKFAGSIILFAMIPLILPFFHRLELSIEVSIVFFQMLLAVINALSITPFSAVLRRISERVFPSGGNPGEPVYLNAELRNTPAVSLSLVSMELIRLANFIEAHFCILFSSSADNKRLSALSKNIVNLSQECRSYFTTIPLPQDEPTLRRRYFNISIMLPPLEVVTSALSKELPPVWTPYILNNEAFREITDELLSVIRLSFCSFALKDDDIIVAAKKHIRNFWLSENRLRYFLLNKGQYGDDDGALLSILSVFVKIVYASERILENVRDETGGA